MHFKKGKIKGSNITYRTNIEINDESIQGILNYLKGDVKRGMFYDLINVGMDGVKIQDLSLQKNSIRGNIIIQNIKGNLELIASQQDSEFESDADEENDVALEFSTTFEQWDYKQIKDLLFDISAYQTYILDYLNKEYKYKQYKTVVEFETHSEPLILSYINKENNLNNSITVKLSNNLDAKFFDKHCEFIGVKTSSDVGEILNAISWYV